MKRHSHFRARNLLEEARGHQSDVENFIALSMEEASQNRLSNSSKYKRLAWEAAERRKEALLAAANAISLDLEPGDLPDLVEKRVEDAIEFINSVVWSRDDYGH